MVNYVMLDGPGPKRSDAPNLGMPTPQELDYRACPTGLGPTACAVSKTIYSGCYAGAALVGEGVVGIPLVARSLYNDFFGTLQKIPASVVHAVNEVGENGIGKLSDGQFAEGTFNIVHGMVTLLGISAGAKGMGALAMKAAPKIYGVYADGVNQLLSRRPTPFSVDPFDIAVRRNPEFGGVRMTLSPSYVAVGTGIIKQLENMGVPLTDEMISGLRVIQVQQKTFGFNRYHFSVKINPEGAGPTFEIFIARAIYKTISAPPESVIAGEIVSEIKLTVPPKTYADLGFTAQDIATMSTREVLGVVHSLVPRMGPMLDRLMAKVMQEAPN